jgi:hypothetical protein
MASAKLQKVLENNVDTAPAALFRRSGMRFVLSRRPAKVGAVSASGRSILR